MIYRTHKRTQTNVCIDGANKNKEDKNMSELLKKQLFGVEIEFTGISRATAAKVVAEELNASIVGPARDAYYTRKMKDSQ